MDAFQSLSNEASLYGASAEVLEHFSQRRLVNPYRQIAVLVEFGPLLHWARLLFGNPVPEPAG